MGDPVSLAASIAGLIALTIQVIDINKRYIDSVRGASKAIKTYLREVVTLQAAINALHDRLKDPGLRAHLADCQRSSPELLKTSSVGIGQCSADLQRIRDKVARKDTHLPLLNRLTWFFSEGEIEDAIRHIQRYRSMIIEDFNNTLAVIVVIDTKDLKLSVGEVEKLGNEALDRLDRIDGQITSIRDTSLKTLGTVQDISKDLSLLNLYHDGTW
jgi:DNA-binding FrmR family transcriptional regulator